MNKYFVFMKDFLCNEANIKDFDYNHDFNIKINLNIFTFSIIILLLNHYV